jgi:glycosyltransferase involved in cell wall biosynthesis
MVPLINILIRTSDRPNSFKRLLETIRCQTFNNYRLIVSVDNDQTKEYVIENGIKDFIRMEKNNVLMKTADLYFNFLIASALEGFVWGVDDDDFLPNERVIETITNNIKENMLNIFRMKSRSILPEEHVLKRGGIGTPCFVIPVCMARQVAWQAPYASDYTYIKELSDKFGLDKIHWVDEIICQIDKPNQGSTPGMGREI